jgi:glutamine synthetase
MRTGNAYQQGAPLPQNLGEGLVRFAASPAAKELFGETFVKSYVGLKMSELSSYEASITPWERTHLLPTV